MFGCNSKVAANPEISALGKDVLSGKGMELDSAHFFPAKASQKIGHRALHHQRKLVKTGRDGNSELTRVFSLSCGATSELSLRGKHLESETGG